MKKMLHLFTNHAIAAGLALILLLAASRLTAQAGEALNFDGSNDLVSLSNSGNLPTSTTPFTIETWIYVEATSEAFPTVFSQNGDNLVMWLHSGSGYSLAARVGGAQVDGTAVSLNTWTHVALTFDGSTSRLYQNGSLTGTAGGGNPNTSATFYMGYWPGYGRFFKGSLDEFRIWSGARTGAEISANMGSEIATMPNSLVGYYKFNEGTANGNNAGVTTLPDIANSTSETGTLSDFALTGSSSNWTTGSGIAQTCSSYNSNIPEINLVGNGNSIPDGTSSTSSSNFTDFGNALNNLGKSRAFTIQNTTGTGDLTISAINFSGTNSADFSASGISLPATIAAGGSATFNVLFNPASTGSKSATINILSDDCDEGNYDFALSGTGTNTFTFSSNSDWATAANWDVEVVPVTANLTSGRSVVIAQNCSMNDVVVTFASGTSLTVNTSKSLSAGLNTYITIASGATLTVQAGGSISQGRITNTGTMNISGSYTAFYMTNNSGGQLNILSGGSYACPACAEAFQAGGTINNSGTMHVGTASTWQGTINNNAGGTITDGGNGAQIQLGASSTLNNYGSFVSRTAGTSGIFNNYPTGTLTMPATCNFTVKSGSTFTNDGTVTVGNSDNFFYVNSGGTVTNNATFKGIGTVTQSGTFSNVSPAAINPGNSPGKLTVSGSLDLGSGTYNCEINGTVQGTSYDWLAVSGNATLTNATLTVTWGFTPTAGQTFTVLTCGSRTGEFATVNIPAVSGLVFTVTHSAGGVTISASSAPVTYTFTGSGNWSSAGNWDANGIPPTPLLPGNAIVINGSGTCTMDVNQTLNAGATLTVNASKTLTISGAFTLTNHGSMTINGTLSKSSANSTLTNSATGSITVPSGGALNNDSGSFSNAGTLTTNSGGTFGNGSGTFTNSGTYNNGGSNYSTYGGFSNSGTITNTGTMTGSQYINIQNSGSWTNSAGGSMTMNSLVNSGASASLTNNGTMNVGLNNSKTFVNNATFTVNYFDETNNSGATWTNSSGATFTVGAVPFSNAGTFNNDGTMTLNQNGNTGSTFANTGTFNCAGTLTLNSGSATNAATKTISLSGTLNLNSAFAFTNNGIINGGGTLNVAGGSLANNGSISSLGLIGLTGNGTLTVASGSTFSTSNGSNTNITSGTLTVNSGATATMGGQLDIFSGGTLNVNGAMTVSGFAFNNAGIIKGSGTITPTTALSNSGFLRPGNSPGTLSFSGDLHLGSGTYTAEVDGTTAGQFDLLAVSGTATIGGSSKLHLIFSVPIINGTTFDVLTAGTVSGSFSGGNVTFANTGTGNVTAVALSYPGGNMVRVTATSLLPVELVRFTGKETDGKVLLEWETASELNNEGFHVERSVDGSFWENTGFVAGNGTTTGTQRYQFLDEKPLPGVNYYRLRQRDFDGKEEFSQVVAIDLSALQALTGVGLRAFPNPVSGGELTVVLPGSPEANLTGQLFDADGRLVLSMRLSAGENRLDVERLGAGTYILRAGRHIGRITLMRQ
jgi:hypothetical protein